MRNLFLTFIFIMLMAVYLLANPMPEMELSYVQAYPPEIGIYFYEGNDISGVMIITKSDTAIVDEGVIGYYDETVILDSSNTSGFEFDPEGDIVEFSPMYIWNFAHWGNMGMHCPPIKGHTTEFNSYMWWDPFVFDFADPSWGTTGIVINEINAHESWATGSGFIELYNKGSIAIPLGGWRIVCDTVYQIPDGVIIEPGGFYVIDQTFYPLLFDMDYDADNIYLISQFDYLKDQVGWSSDHGVEVSFMRYPDGDVDSSNDNEGYMGYNDSTSYTFEEGFPSRGAPNRHDSPGLVVIGVNALALDIGIDLGWTNPIWEPDFDEVRVVRNIEHFPESVDDGATIYEGESQQFFDIGAPINNPIHYTIFAKDMYGQFNTPTEESQILVIYGTVGIEKERLPNNISYLKAYPNPFNSNTIIRFEIFETENVNLSVYNMLGQHIQNLVTTKLPAGEHEIVWDADNYSSGVYLVRLEILDQATSIKIELLK
jgi:hypothetical protein